MKYCKSCGKLHDGFRELCSACIRRDEDYFVKIKRFLEANPNTTAVEISDMLGIDEDIIIEMIREGRLKLADNLNRLTCQKCGAPIAIGRLCDKCILDLKAVSDALAKMQNTAPLTQDSKRTAAILRDLKDRR